MTMQSCLVATPAAPNALIARQTAGFPPSIWGDRFHSYTSDEETLCAWKGGGAETLKTEVLKMLNADDELASKNCVTKISLIDAIQRLGVAYHFEDEIEEELSKIFTTYFQNHNDDDDSLHIVALRFRLLREHGYNVTCEMFRKFMDDKGNFKDSLCEDVEGMLSLYEASCFRVHGEAILDNALNFTTSRLQSMVPHLSPLLAKQVLEALNRPLRKCLPRVEARKYFTIYEHDEHHNRILLRFAKLDFNVLQKSHQEELSIMSRWWKDLDFAKRLPFVRDRIVEIYFWILGAYFEPQYAMARRFLTQVTAMASVVDDIYDAYGTKEELELFTKAVDRWDVSAVVDLPEYMKICYQELLAVYRRMEEAMIKEGKPIYAVQYAKEAMTNLMKSYLEQTKWLDRDEPPKMEEYMRVGFVSSGYPMMAISSFVGMGDIVNRAAFDWLLSEPKIIYAVSTSTRLTDDIMSHKFEQERGHSPTAVECYTRQYGVSEKEAYEALRILIENAWKDITEGFFRPTPVARPLLMRMLNFSCVTELIYKENDGYTHVTKTIQEYIISMLSSAVEL